MLTKVLRIVVFFISVSFTSASFATSYCQTHITCAVGLTCSCDIMASAFDRFFYVDYERIQSGHQYFCQLETPPFPLIVALENSHIPQGATATPIAGGLLIHTEQMTAPFETVSIKFFIPGSDYGVQIKASCQLQS